MTYVNFDGLFDRFSQQIYQTQKGRLRMHLIDALYNRYLPIDSFKSLSVLDAAGGLGQMSHWFMNRGASVNYFDVSNDMVSHVNSSFSNYVESTQLKVQQGSISSISFDHSFDIVNIHAVLEWLEDPLPVLESALRWVRPGGYIGLMVYNKHMLMLRNLMRGTLKRAMSGEIAGDKRGLTPISPLDPIEISQLLQNNGFSVITQAGIRSFSDLAEKTVVDWYEEEDLFDAELQLCEQRPYCDMARYVLFIARKPS